MTEFAYFETDFADFVNSDNIQSFRLSFKKSSCDSMKAL